jgi:hypothetical protein
MKPAIDRYKVVRRLIILVCLGLSCAVVIKGISVMTQLDAQTVAFISLVLGLLGTPVAYYFKLRKDEDSQ